MCIYVCLCRSRSSSPGRRRGGRSAKPRRAAKEWHWVRRPHAYENRCFLQREIHYRLVLRPLSPYAIASLGVAYIYIYIYIYIYRERERERERYYYRRCASRPCGGPCCRWRSAWSPRFIQGGCSGNRV